MSVFVRIKHELDFVIVDVRLSFKPSSSDNILGIKEKKNNFKTGLNILQST